MPGRRLPMFPLGTVLLPFAHLPLHIFEPRYRALVKDCLAGDGEFGVVLIERGHEVGGGDVRFAVGTVARILQTAELPDGRWLVDAVGTERFRVTEWLPEDPYPQALVEDFDDEPFDAMPGAETEAAERRTAVERLLRQVLALQVEMGFPAPSAVRNLDDDPVTAAYEAALLSPLGPMDSQKVLEAPGTVARLTLLETLLDDARDVLTRRIAED
ncbi:MAG TPA: LON peptidase substrate-binding domain-containing protein [Acidimicrobiia bacterium]|nr:LON peptidase substrate-binding domain-containing protein [Acidimicrobiia bacterium]